MNLIKKIFAILFASAVYVIKILEYFFKFLTAIITFLTFVFALSYIGTIPQPAQGIILNVLIFGGIFFLTVFVGFNLLNSEDAHKIWKKIMKEK